MRRMLGLLVLLLAVLLAGRSGALPSSASSPPLPPFAPEVGLQAILNPIPRQGDQPLLVLLVDFSDQPGLFSGQQWREFFFGQDGLSEYVREASYDLLRYHGDIVGVRQGQPLVNDEGVAYIRLPYPLTYYADGQYGFKVGWGQFPRNHSGVVYHALEALDAAGFDWTPYADPETGRIENLIVVFAGSSYGYTRDPVHSLEATAYRLAWGGIGPYTTTSGQVVDNYTFCPDQSGVQSGRMAKLGICMHEHGHALGMYDLYDFSYTTSGVGYFDLMAYGTYGGTAGLRPFHPGVFSKELFGWVTPAIAPVGTITVTLPPAETHAAALKLIPSGQPDSDEYFLLENRQPLGFDQDWRAVGLCPGLVIWHVDQEIVRSYPYKLNTLPSAGGPPHPGVMVVEADGEGELTQPPLHYGECSDSWQPGQRWASDTTPSSRLWDGRDSQLVVTVLHEAAGALTLRIEVGGIDLPYHTFLPLVSRDGGG